MRFTRRETLGLTAATLAAAVTGSRRSQASGGRIEAIAFDAFPVFDPRPIFGLVERLVPERGKALAELWRTRQFEYTWLRTAARRYDDFWNVTKDALGYAADALKVDLSPAQADEIMDAYLGLKGWPDTRAALEALREAGYRLGFLSNFTPRMLRVAIASAGLDGMFERVLSTDAVRTFKPAPEAYKLAIDGFGVPRERILFVPFAGWDAAGAKWFGYETFWVNRLGMPPEALGATVDGTGRNLDDLVAYLRARA